MSRAYYNEHDPFAARWLRNLIAAGELPAGEVDERDIQEVRPGDLDGFAQCHFFAGIGGWPLALRLAGWPDDRPAWTGSCPCQPFSAAGRRRGAADERHLWPAWFRLIAERRPECLFGEQVASPAGLAWLDLVCADLEGAGYAVGALDLPAAGVGAPHVRQRLWFVADAARQGGQPLPTGPGRGADPDAHGARAAGIATCGVGQVDTAGPGRQRITAGAFGAQRAAPERGGAAHFILADPAGRGLLQGAAPRGGPEGQGDGPSDHGALADADGRANGGSVAPPGLGGLSEQDGGAGADPWAAPVWLPCRDGKARPAQPLLRQVAHGLPGGVGRGGAPGGGGAAGGAEEGPPAVLHPLAVGVEHRAALLRGYGNAIVPQLAAEVVRAAMGLMSRGD